MPDGLAPAKWGLWMLLVPALAVLLGGAILYLVGRRGDPARRDYPDYSAMLQFYPQSANVRMPAPADG